MSIPAGPTDADTGTYGRDAANQAQEDHYWFSRRTPDIKVRQKVSWGPCQGEQKMGNEQFPNLRLDNWVTKRIQQRSEVYNREKVREGREKKARAFGAARTKIL